MTHTRGQIELNTVGNHIVAPGEAEPMPRHYVGGDTVFWIQLDYAGGATSFGSAVVTIKYRTASDMPAAALASAQNISAVGLFGPYACAGLFEIVPEVTVAHGSVTWAEVCIRSAAGGQYTKAL
jgi:hypothetical protein